MRAASNGDRRGRGAIRRRARPSPRSAPVACARSGRPPAGCPPRDSGPLATHVRRPALLATLPRRVPRGADAAAVQHLDPAARPRKRRRRLPAARAEPLRPAVGEGALPRPHLANSPRRPKGGRSRSRSAIADGATEAALRQPGRRRADAAPLPPPRAGTAVGHVHAAGAAAPARADEPQPGVHVRDLRRRQGQPARARRRRCRSPSTRPPTTRCSSTAASGLGKTHLIQAIGNTSCSATPAAKIRYIHAETYVSDVVRAYQHKAFDDFKRYYRSLDLLLIDDIQFFSGKNRTQEEFFYLFNTLIEAHKQVVITCDTYPKEIAGIEERLISRFGWGLTVALEPPELEMRVAILLAKAAATRPRARRAGRVLHRQAHPLQRARARRRAEARPRLLELPRPGDHAGASPRRRCATCSPSRTARSRSRTSRRRSPTTTRSGSRTCTRRSARAPSRGRARSRWRWPRN